MSPGCLFTTIKDRNTVEPGTFIPGVTRPQYVPTANFTGAKNIGNLKDSFGLDVARTPYGSTVTNGVTQLNGATYNNTDFNDTILDLRAATMTFNNCRIYLSATSDYVISDGIRGMIRILNGACALITFNDCEIHCRGQRVLSAIVGRNTIFNRTVITGGVDGPDDSANGGAPLNFGFQFNDCWIGESAWWRTPSLPWEGHGSDVRTHNDDGQLTTTLGTTYNNTTLVSYASEFVGTGTPNSGSDTGNSYVPSSGTNYILTQATQNAYRAGDLTYYSLADQSMDGVSRRLSDVGSWACVMCNNGPVTLFHCYLDGGLACVNIADNTGTMVGKTVSIKQCVFWNGMVNPVGHGTAKGHAVLARLASGNGIGSGLDMPTTGPDKNVWFDGTTVFPTWLA